MHRIALAWVNSSRSNTSVMRATVYIIVGNVTLSTMISQSKIAVKCDRWEPLHISSLVMLTHFENYKITVISHGYVYFGFYLTTRVYTITGIVRNARANTQGPLLLTLIPAWIGNHMPCKVWDQITYPFPNFNGSTVEVWEWINNFIPHIIIHVITYPCCG